MANVNGLSSNSYSSTSSIYGNRNILSGLASGLDTEAMIENSISGYQAKIAALQQKQTKLEWKQDAYRNLIDEAAGLSNKYTSYTSDSNLMSANFFSGAAITDVLGSHAEKLSATGKTSSDIQVNAVKSLATAARRAVDTSSLNLAGAMRTTGDAIDWNGTKLEGGLNGSISLKVGSNTLALNFTSADTFNNYEDLAKNINDQLSKLNASSAKDGIVKASSLVNATVSGNGIKFNYTGKDGDALYISNTSGNLATLGVKTGKLTDIVNSFSLNQSLSSLNSSKSMPSYLSGKSVDVTLNGNTKSIKIGDLSAGATTADLAASLQEGIDSAFGQGNITVNTTSNGALDFSVKTGSNLKVESDIKQLGLGNGLTNYLNTSSTLKDLLGDELEKYARLKGGDIDFNTWPDLKDTDGNAVDIDGYRLDENGEYLYNVDNDGKRLYDLNINGKKVGSFSEDTSLESLMSAINNSDAGATVSFSQLTGQFVFNSKTTGEGSSIEFGDGLADRLFNYDSSRDVLSKKLGDVIPSFNWDRSVQLRLGNENVNSSFTKNLTVQDFVNRVNRSASGTRGVISFNDETGAFEYRARTSDGSQGELLSTDNLYISVGSDPSQKVLFSDIFNTAATRSVTDGTDAVINATVNGKTLDIKRSSNVVDLDGLSVTLKKTFETGDNEEAVSFNTHADSDKIVDAVKDFVNEYNTLVKNLHSAYTTTPLEKNSSTHERYEPLSEQDKADMSETAVKNYEDKAKQGLLFADSDLSSMYSKLLGAITPGGDMRKAMESIGLTTEYSGGLTTLKLNESRLRTALENDAESVRNVFVDTPATSTSAAQSGLMSRMKKTLDSYVSTSITTPGILVRKAGTTLSSLSLTNNSLQSDISRLNDDISSWQTKMSNKIDYYTRQFTALEQLMSTMNEQSTALANLMGGGGY